MPGTKESRLGTNCWKWESLGCGIFNGAKGEQNTNRNDVVMVKLLMQVDTIWYNNKLDEERLIKLACFQESSMNLLTATKCCSLGGPDDWWRSIFQLQRSLVVLKRDGTTGSNKLLAFHPPWWKPPTRMFWGFLDLFGWPRIACSARTTLRKMRKKTMMRSWPQRGQWWGSTRSHHWDMSLQFRDITGRIYLLQNIWTYIYIYLFIYLYVIANLFGQILLVHIGAIWCQPLPTASNCHVRHVGAPAA